MPQILKKYQPKKRQGSKPKYDLDTLFSGKWIRLVRGVDFQCTALSLVQMLRKHAAKRKPPKKLRMHIEDQSTVVLRALPGKKNQKDAKA